MNIRGNLNILVVDDGLSEAETLMNELKSEGMPHILKRTKSKDSFEGALNDFKPNLIIADYCFPDFDGKNILDIARTSNPDMMFILVDRKLGEEVIIDLMRDGRNEFKLVDKPSNFIPAIKSAIQRASLRIKDRSSVEDFGDLLGRLDDALEGIAKVDENGAIIKCNNTFCRILDEDGGSYNGEEIENIVDLNDVEAWSGAYNSMLKRGKAKAEIKTVKRNGTSFYAGIQILKNTGNDGEYTGYYFFMEDISEKKRAERSIREAQNITAASLNSLNERVAIIDSDGIILAVNRAWTAFALQNHENPKKTSVGVNYIEVCEDPADKNPRESREFANGIRRVLDGEISEFSVMYPHNTPLQKRWFLAKVSKFYGEGSRKAVVLHADITKSRQSEIELAKNEEKFRNLVKHSSDIISVLDKDGTLKYISDSAARVFGVNTNYRKGRNVFEFIHPDDIEKVKLAFQRGFESPNDPVTIEFRYKKPDGSYICLESIANNLLLDPSVEGIVVNSRDVTDRKAAEELTKAALKEKNLLLREVHHRVKNNLQIVSSLLKLQEDNISDKGFKKIFKESINRIKAMSLIHQRLYQERRLSQINFGAYLSGIVEFLKETYDANSKNINCKIIAENVDLNLETAVPAGLIVNEIVSNSLRHAFRGRKEGELLVKLESNGSNSITISDNGIGLPKGFNLQEAKTLGLQMVYNLAVQLNADVKLETGKGTTYVITFDNLIYTQRVKEEKI